MPCSGSSIRPAPTRGRAQPGRRAPARPRSPTASGHVPGGDFLMAGAVSSRSAGAVPHAVMAPLASGFVLLLLPQLQRLPFWLSAVAVLTCAWSVGQHYRWWRPLSKPWRLLLMFALVVIFITTHVSSFTVETAAAFFVLTVALKWTELERPRDVFIMVMILCYLAAVTFLFEQGIFWSLAVLLAVLVLFGSLRSLSGGGAKAGPGAWRSMAWTLLKVLPVVVVLFFIFPRLGPLWSVPLVSEGRSAGLSESMTPGDFADLGRSGERAFRVSFGGAAPAPSQRYWRGLILDQFDGQTWSRSQQASGDRVGRVNRSAGIGELGAGEYEVLLEPSFQPWAYALGGTRPLTGNVMLTEHGLVQFSRPVDTVVRYRMQQSDLDTMAPVDAGLRARYTALPEGFNPETRAWAQRLAADAASDSALIDTLMTMFSELPFFYTLQPAPTGTHSVDEFLFQTREGFCAHYAGALTFALRAAGIPARVVAGYLGGEPGLNNDYLLVRQYDAHAWVEAWVGGPSGGQWLRLDPTAMVAPERVQENWRQALERGEGESATNWARRDYASGPVLDWVNLRLDAANYYWQRFVVDYQGDTQRSLFGKFPGAPSLATLGYWTAAFLAGVVAVVGLVMIRQERTRPSDPVMRYAMYWYRWLKRRNIQTTPGQTPLQQAELAAREFPRHRASVIGFARALNGALYNPESSATLQDLAQRWQRLKKVPRSAGRRRSPSRA
ncbi:DUF3488 domain-containing protein [Hydrocarboniclastica marina]|uniref:DUF3488 domain-containing protein n=2 Tax=Hydrocarboniclastica marina TaxID=2259620 RepID=A0A4P7XIS0_9ALTE|nr:DUF3488 domain-containing protein [Hydrocarboniclastica marina]